jgi:hypothetical protein
MVSLIEYFLFMQELEPSSKLTTLQIATFPTVYVLTLCNYSYPDYEIMTQAKSSYVAEATEQIDHMVLL